MTRPDYIFIVGMDRSGTSLTRRILNNSDAIGLAGESQYFRRRPHWSFLPDHGHLGLFKKISDISTKEGANVLVDYLFSDPEYCSNFWRFSRNGFDRDEFLCRLLDTGHDERALLDLTLSFHARGKHIRGDKTPANIYFIPKIMEWFQNVKIIQTLRDPRAIYQSRKKKQEKHLLPLSNRLIRKTGPVFELYASSRLIIDWRQSIWFYQHYKEEYAGRYYLSKYEDLIQNPENSIYSLCNFLEIDFVPEMLQQQVVNSSFAPRDRSQAGFDTTAIDRWRKQMHPLIKKWITFWCKDQLQEFGYPI